MIKVNIEKELDAPVSKVWELLENFGNLDWYPGWDRIEVIGSGIGMTRRIHMTGMDPIDEVLQSMDAASRSFSYTIPKMPMPVSEYRASVALESLDNGERTLAHWRCEAKPEGIEEADGQAMLEGIYADMLAKLETAARS
ncbi:SRPBCC family protein [Haliea sp. E1-2-M8]|uniref:SRPBCC family protein n=1 Tax=Haliea sp. E1-2-M8 TaxID=3064706 RepID=UPI00271668B0|nr:SRPBCC family protein [Haliea sp. E1-2-M8]MDO8861909.1 SRPBCC family protein [Haliea sp. E1-2-M8]